MMKKISFETLWAGILGIIAISASIVELFISGITTLTVISAIKDIAETLVVVMVFFAAIRHVFSKKEIDKLDYLEFWEENDIEILKSNSMRDFTKQILYGMPILIHNGDHADLLDYIKKARRSPKLDNDARTTLDCVLAMLNVFISINSTDPLGYEKFSELQEALATAYEDDIKDADVAAWCKILRNDKQQLLLEKYADSLNGEEKRKYLGEAIAQCNECIKLLDAQIKSNTIDSNYALLFCALTKRNLSQLYKKLNNTEKEREFCENTLEDRQKLFSHYKLERNSNGITMDYITQEYILALVEQYRFTEDKESLKAIIDELYGKMKAKKELQNMIIKKIESEINTFTA